MRWPDYQGDYYELDCTLVFLPKAKQNGILVGQGSSCKLHFIIFFVFAYTTWCHVSPVLIVCRPRIKYRWTTWFQCWWKSVYDDTGLDKRREPRVIDPVLRVKYRSGSKRTLHLCVWLPGVIYWIPCFHWTPLGNSPSIVIPSLCLRVRRYNHSQTTHKFASWSRLSVLSAWKKVMHYSRDVIGEASSA